MPENSQKLLPVLVLNFGYVLPFSTGTGNFLVSDFHRKVREKSSPPSLLLMHKVFLMPGRPDPNRGTSRQFPVQNREIGADFWAGDPTKHFSMKKKGFSVKGGEGFSERGVW